MATAGRILIIPKGTWEFGREYENLDLVTHNGRAWLAKKPSVDIVPDEYNSEYWHDMLGSEFLSTKGGDITGVLAIKNGDYYTEFHNADGRTYIRTKKTDDEYLDLLLGWDIDPCFAAMKNGTYSRYAIYGEHNNPSTLKPVVVGVTSEKDIEDYFDTLKNDTLTVVKFNVLQNINSVINHFSFIALVSKMNTAYGNITGFVPAVGIVSNRISGGSWSGWKVLGG